MLDKISHIKYLLNSFNKYLGRELVQRKDDQEDVLTIESASFVVVSHNGGDDPILNYGNKTALNLWEMDWEDFVKTPSRLTAEMDKREKRAEMLQLAKKNGFFDDYSGIRISSTGKRFEIKKAIIWTVENDNGDVIGQAATFSDWDFL